MVQSLVGVQALERHCGSRRPEGSRRSSNCRCSHCFLIAAVLFQGGQGKIYADTLHGLPCAVKVFSQGGKRSAVASAQRAVSSLPCGEIPLLRVFADNRAIGTISDEFGPLYRAAGPFRLLFASKASTTERITRVVSQYSRLQQAHPHIVHRFSTRQEGKQYKVYMELSDTDMLDALQGTPRCR